MIKISEISDVLVRYIRTFSYHKYGFTIEECLYDYIESTYTLTVRAAYSAVFFKINIHQLINSQQIISNLHQYDAYFIGLIYALYVQGVAISIQPSFNRQKATNKALVRWIGSDIAQNQLIFQHQLSQAVTNISLEDFFQDQTILLAMCPLSAYSLGQHVSRFFTGEVFI